MRWNSDGLISFEERGCEMQQLPDEMIAVWNDGCFVLHLSPYLLKKIGPFYQAIPEEQGRIFELKCGSHDIARIRYKQITALSVDVFRRGEKSATTVGPASEPFEPVSDEFEPIPAAMRKSDSHHVQNIEIDGLRFSRLTPDGVMAKMAAREAAVRAERERKAAEAEAARLKREEDDRQAEEARMLSQQAEFDRWFNETIPFPPGTLVVDIEGEINPCLGRVEYDGLFQEPDGGWYLDGPVEKLPKFVKINYGNRPEREFSIERRGLKEQFITYEGSMVVLGTRIARADALNGQPDPFPPCHGDLVKAGIEFSGREYTPDVGEDFTIEHALEFLSEKAPYQSGFATVYDDGDDGDYDYDGESGGGRRAFRQRVSQSLEERYQDLFRYESRTGCYLIRGDNIGSPWRDYPWRGHDRKLLEAEERRRIAANAEWDNRKKYLLHFMKALRADLSQIENGDLYGGALCRLALTEFDLDKLEEFLRRECNCEVQTGYYRDEIAPDVLDRHVLPPGRLDEVIGKWRRFGRSGPVFIGATDHLITDDIEQHFIVEGLLPAGSMSMLVGPAKLGKSTIAMQIAMSVASGETFAGLKTEGGRVMYLHGEGTEVSLRKQRADAGFESDNLIAINARNYGEHDIENALDKALDDLEGEPGLSLLVVDALEAFVPNSSDSNAIHRTTDRLAAFSEKTGAAVLVIHHDTKDVTAENATSARQVAAKAKGSGRIGNAARATITLHRKGENRVLTLVNTNIPLTVSRLQNSLEFTVDYETGLWCALNEPMVATGKAVAVPPRKASGKVIKAEKQSNMNSDDADAHLAAPEINRLQAEVGRKLAYAGAKSLYSLKGKGDPVGWTRARCEQAHRRAVELGLIEAV